MEYYSIAIFLGLYLLSIGITSFIRITKDYQEDEKK